jgi:hypothetical protein
MKLLEVRTAVRATKYDLFTGMLKHALKTRY